MDNELFDAASKGSVDTLHNLLQRDSLVMTRISAGCAETPLHIACLVGHVNFAREILKLCPTFSQQLNQDGYTPLHLASSNGHVDIVRLLLEFGHEHTVVAELCKRKDQDGRTPLHCAVVRGKVNVISELIAACPESALEVTVRGETVLHLALKNNQHVAFLFLVQHTCTDALLNMADSEGNTILHLATFRKQIQAIRFLTSQPSLDVNAVNSFGLSAMDLLLIGATHCNDLEIGERIRSAGGERSQTRYVASTKKQVQPITNSVSSGQNGNNMRSILSIQNMEQNERDCKHCKNMTDGVLIMASVVVGFTCQIAVSPPGAFFQGSPPSFDRTAIADTNAAYTKPYYTAYTGFVAATSQAFLVSLSLIMTLLSPVMQSFIGSMVVRCLTYYLALTVIGVFFEAISFITHQNIFVSHQFYLYDVPWLIYMVLIIGGSFKYHVDEFFRNVYRLRANE